MDTPKKHRWWNRLRISLGAFLTLVLVIGGWLGWIVHSGRIQRDAVAAIGVPAVEYGTNGNIRTAGFTWGNSTARGQNGWWILLESITWAT